MSHFPQRFSTLEDFLENAAFRRWVKERRAEDRVYWQEWLALNPEKREIYENAVALYIAIQDSPVEQPEQPTPSTDHTVYATGSARELVVNWNWMKWTAAAAILVSLLWWQFETPLLKSIASKEVEKVNYVTINEWRTVVNDTDDPELALLPENSSVLLSPGSQIRFREGINSPLREVYLNGEGFFEVSKNPDKPFMVYTTNLTTKVLGTSFQVRSFDDEATSFVKVKTGKVTVFPTKSPKNQAFLNVNEQLTINTKSEKVEKQKQLIASEASTDIISNPFRFEFSPVPYVLDQLESTYHMPIRYNRNLLQNCTFTGQLDDVPFIEKIRLICLTIESDFEIVDNQIVIQSRGCN
jgi:transmembrane sensor